MALSERQQLMLLRWAIWSICIAALINEFFLREDVRPGVLAFIVTQLGLPNVLFGGSRRRRGG